ncbi:hypothetical protein [Nocardia testacea]|uniref:hypothetical protein n=1 Tax=Nocardia testacea TaxID=248551 RepID=UPI00340A3902
MTAPERLMRNSGELLRIEKGGCQCFCVADNRSRIRRGEHAEAGLGSMSPPGYNGGFFNHYDDPDEFWDEEPLTPTQRGASSSYTAPITHPAPRPTEHPSPGTGPDRESSTPTWNQSDSFTAEDTRAAPGSSFATVEVDRGLLPIQLRLGPQWHRHVGPGDTGDELMRAYKKAVEACLGKLVTGEFRHACPVPDRRTVLMLLLDTSSWPEYRETQRRILTRGTFDVHGRALVDGAPAISITADCFQLKSIFVRPEWAQKAHPMDLVDEFLSLADRVRELRPSFPVRGDYSRYSDEDLEFHHSRHRDSLVEGLGV